MATLPFFTCPDCNFGEITGVFQAGPNPLEKYTVYKKL
jgi:hypothetical protein